MASILYAEIYAICIIIDLLCMVWLNKGGNKSASELWLFGALVAFLVNFAANFCFVLFNSIWVIGALQFPLSYFFKTVYHISLCAGVFCWCGYANTERRSNLFQNKKTMFLMMLPFFVLVAGIIANLWNHWLFEINDQGAYVRHAMFQYEMGALLAALLGFSIPLFIHAVTETDPVKRSHELLITSFPLAFLLSWLLSRVGESIPVICVCLTIELLCVFMSASTQQISLDKLTQVNNRQNLLGFLDYKMHNHDELLFLLMIDVDYFKTINDTYGHLEGDHALVRVASALKKACAPFRKRPYISRYGGDEFIVFIEGSRAEADALCNGIRQTLQEMNEAANTPYTLTVSIGVGSWWPSMTMKDLIAAADEALYEVKKARKK